MYFSLSLVVISFLTPRSIPTLFPVFSNSCSSHSYIIDASYIPLFNNLTVRLIILLFLISLLYLHLTIPNFGSFIPFLYKTIFLFV